MKKVLFFGTCLVSCIPAFAGGLLTNTNQSAAFLRNPSRDAVIATEAVYSNPAGTAFLDNGFHLTLNIQNAKQRRQVVSTFGPFAYGLDNNGKTGKRFKGDADAPIIPSFQAVYKTGYWSFSSSFAISGGGGKCTFENGLGSFEAIASLLPLLGQSIGITGYNMDSYMRGRQYYYGFQLGAARQLNKNLSVFLGARGIYASTNYYGYIRNIEIEDAQGTSLATQRFQSLHDQAVAAAAIYRDNGNIPMANMYEAQAAQMRTMAYATQDVTLNCDQTGFGVTPIIGIDWKINDQWNLAAKYEFKTRIRLKNEAANSASAAGLSALNQFKDGKKIAEDIPAMLTLGVQYTPVKNVRLMAGHHYFYDKQASKYNHTEKKLSRGTCEFNAGAEVDVNKRLTLSAGWQNTNYGLTDEYMQDISFVTNSNSVGIGLNYRFSDRLSIDLSYFQTFYNTYDTHTDDFNGVSSMITSLVGAETATQLVSSGVLKGSNHYWRTNRVIGIGVTLDF